MQNEHPNRESNISLTNNKKISHNNISTEKEQHRGNPRSYKDTERKNDKKEKPKLKNSAVKKPKF